MSLNNGARENLIPEWIAESMKALKPPEKMTVSEWADKNRILDPKSSNEPGLWRTSRTPYLKGIMDAFTNPDVEEIVFVKPTQVGGTESLLNILAYIIAQDASPVMVIYPTDTLAEYVSKNRITPMVRLSPALSHKFHPWESKLLELQFDGMFLALSGANSPSQLASRPIRFLLLDEVDKYPPRAGKESDPISLARERTKTFAYNKKIVLTSTPTYAEGAVWQAYQKCETQFQYYVPCPHCGKYQLLRFRQLKFESHYEGEPISSRADSARYECAYCGQEITDADKADILKKGEWRAEKDGSKQKVGFHLNALYSPWVSFRDVAHEWLKSQTDLEAKMNFINSWLAEPWEPVGLTAGSETILSHQGRFTRGIVPDGTLLITGGVDKQTDRLYYTIRGWGRNRVSWNIDHGCVDTMKEIYQIFDRPYYDERGGAYFPNLVLFDSGNETNEVYDFCFLHQGLFLPVKGASTEILTRFRQSVIDKTDSAANGMPLIICDGNYYKDQIFNLIKRQIDGWYVFDGCDTDYAEQMTSEHKVMEITAGRQVWRWKVKHSGIDNHYLDCEVYAACAADVMGGFDLLFQDDPQPVSKNPVQEKDDPEMDWIGGGDWVGENGGDWI